MKPKLRINTPTGEKSSRWLVHGLSAGLVVLCLLFPGAARCQARITIQFSHVVAPDTSKGKAALRFKELAEARAGGRVRVEIFPNSTLYKDREELEALQLGAVQMLAPSLSKLAILGGADFEAYDLPFLFKDRAAFRAVAEGEVGRTMLKRLEAKGIKGLAYWDNGFKVMTANKPLHRVADFSGVRFRVQSSRVITAQMRAMGADPAVMPLSDTYAALKDGLVDAQEGIPSNIYTQRTHEQQKHLTVSNHAYLAYAVIVNKTFWDGLPSDVRTTLEGALKDATVYGDQIAASDNAQALEKIKASGKTMVYTPSPVELSEWRRAMQRVYDEAPSWIDKHAIAAMRLAAGSGPR